jgi:hypothetical protein
MYICVYIIYTYMYIYMYVCVLLYIHIYIFMCIHYIDTHVSMCYAYMYIYLSIYVSTFLYSYVNVLSIPHLWCPAIPAGHMISVEFFNFVGALLPSAKSEDMRVFTTEALERIEADNDKDGGKTQRLTTASYE